MKRQTLRVLLASEYPEARYFLKELVEDEAGVVVVGQAENAGKALTLAQNLRPDIAIIDCYLPYRTGPALRALSRLAGLDTAQVISREIPNTRVMLLPNLDEKVPSEPGLSSDSIAFFSRKTNGSALPFTLREIYRETLAPGTVVFAHVETKEQHVLRQKIANLSDKAILFGGLGIVGGLCLMLTVILAGAGVFLTLTGGVLALLGLVGHGLAHSGRKTPPIKNRGQESQADQLKIPSAARPCNQSR